MSVSYAFDKDRGFFAFDPAIGYPVYAYPTSIDATQAARRYPGCSKIAAAMLRHHGEACRIARNVWGDDSYAERRDYLIGQMRQAIKDRPEWSCVADDARSVLVNAEV